MAIYPRSVIASTLLIFSFAVSSRAQRIVQQPLITEAVDDGRLVTLKGHTHPLARPLFDIGKAAPDLPLQRMLLVLKRSPEQQTALHKLLDDQHDKASPNYHKWLTPDEFGREFGTADQDVGVVSGWLSSHGFQVDRVSHGRTVIEFTGVAAQVQEALHTEIHKYLVNGQEHWANDRDPQIPAALAPAVAGVWTLHDFRKQPRLHISPNVLKTKYTPGSRPDTTFKTSSGSVVHALSPADFAIIYNLNPLYQSGISGAGKIAVVARSGLFGSDVSDFRNVFGVFGGFVRVINDGPDPGDLGGGEEAEATLDATWSGAVAPQAEVDFVLSSSTTTTDGVDLSELY
ncbi:MAG TPA: protease pro-enzyme activation domain-containing protein, partial [Terriglobales bacterium]|nr:protease pro-enzyme activation domain-containing protein [Terriglobales bacterium]